MASAFLLEKTGEPNHWVTYELKSKTERVLFQAWSLGWAGRSNETKHPSSVLKVKNRAFSRGDTLLLSSLSSTLRTVFQHFFDSKKVYGHWKTVWLERGKQLDSLDFKLWKLGTSPVFSRAHSEFFGWGNGDTRFSEFLWEVRNSTNVLSQTKHETKSFVTERYRMGFDIQFLSLEMCQIWGSGACSNALLV